MHGLALCLKMPFKFFLLFILSACGFNLKAQHDEEWMLKQQFDFHSEKSYLKTSGINTEYDVKFYRLHLHLNPDTLAIRGAVTIGFTAGTSAFTKMEVDISQKLIVDSIVFRNRSEPFVQILTNVCAFTLHQALNKSDFDSITIYYHGQPGITGFGSFLKDTHPDGPVVWTLSQPNGAKDWWPCKNLLTDKADSLDILITCPDRYKAASNGLLVEEWQTDTFKTYHWKHRYPIATYLVAVAISNYVEYTEYAHALSGDSFPILNYVYPSDSAKAKVGTAALIPALEYFENLFGDYPFAKEKYGHAQFNKGGGMEHQTMTFVNSWSIELLTHELAHHWFGDMVTCNSWQHIWLNEGFATYLTGLYYEKFKSATDFDDWKARAIGNIMQQNGGSVFCPDTTEAYRIFDSRLTYTKGAMLVHLLRIVCGDTAFFNGVRSYLQEYQYGFATTPDLLKHLENHSGKNLKNIFSQWFYGEGFPMHTIYWQPLPNNRMRVEVIQRSSSSLVAFFNIPIPIRFCSASQCSTIWLQPTFNNQLFEFSLPFEAEEATFNPHFDLIANATLEKLGDGGGGSCFIYPNPSNGTTKLVSANGLQLTQITITDLRGRVVLHEKLTTPMNPIPVDLSKLSEGVYIITATLANGDETHLRLVKAH